MEKRKNKRNKKRAQKENALIYYADEASLELLPSVHRTYSKKGITPIIKNRCRYSKLSLISAISERGKLIYQIRQGTFNGKAIVRFLKFLLKGKRRKIILIWDGAMVHHCKDVKQYLSTLTANRLELIKLPPYSPELNADEQVWNYLKHVQLKNHCADNLGALKEIAKCKLNELTQMPQIIKTFFKHPDVGFINS